jgi:type IV secretion system protein VirD4
MDQVPKAAAVLRGYNVTLWPVVQGLGQLKTIYGDKWEIFVNSAVIKHWLSSGTDNTTADYISHRMPQALRFIGNNPDGSPKEKESKLLDTNQVIGFPDIICEISGMASPARFKKVPYWDIPYAGPNASPNPFYA